MSTQRPRPLALPYSPTFRALHSQGAQAAVTPPPGAAQAALHLCIDADTEHTHHTHAGPTGPRPTRARGLSQGWPGSRPPLT